MAPARQQQPCKGARCPQWDSAPSGAAGPGRVSKQAWDQEWVQSAGTPRKEGGSDEGVLGRGLGQGRSRLQAGLGREAGAGSGQARCSFPVPSGLTAVKGLPLKPPV